MCYIQCVGESLKFNFPPSLDTLPIHIHMAVNTVSILLSAKKQKRKGIYNLQHQW